VTAYAYNIIHNKHMIHKHAGVLLGASLLLLKTITGVHAAQVTLSWDPATTANVAGYRLHCGTHSHVYTQQIEVGTATTTLVSNLSAGTTYFFSVTAYDSAFLQSSPSNEVSYTVPGLRSAPSPTPRPTATPTPTATPRPKPSATPKPTPKPTVTPSAPSSDPKISILAAPAKIHEGESTRYRITASKPNPTSALTVNYVMRGKAILGTDYTLSGTPRQATIPAGRTSTTITLTALKTSRSNGSYGARMIITAGAGYKLSGIQSQGRVIIIGTP
jgi:hypothetical protein